jgi:hypothetical protein
MFCKWNPSITCLSVGHQLMVYADWTVQQEDPQNIALWESDWDDDTLRDKFAEELKAQLAAQQQ